MSDTLAQCTMVWLAVNAVVVMTVVGPSPRLARPFGLVMRKQYRAVPVLGPGSETIGEQSFEANGDLDAVLRAKAIMGPDSSFDLWDHERCVVHVRANDILRLLVPY